MNYLLKRLVPALLLLGLAGVPAFGQGKVGTVDLSKVFDKYWKTEQATAALKDRAAEIEKSDKEMKDNWQKSKEEYQKLLASANDQAVSAEERDKRKKTAEDKLKDIKESEDNIVQFERQANANIAAQKERMRKNLLDEIKLVINSRAKAAGYALVIDSGAQTYVADPTGPYYTPTLIYNSNENDLTEAVIAQLKATEPIDLPKADDSKTNAPAGGK
jgi:Skp family chaperone for outer membrane proteins